MLFVLLSMHCHSEPAFGRGTPIVTTLVATCFSYTIVIPSPISGEEPLLLRNMLRLKLLAKILA